MDTNSNQAFKASTRMSLVGLFKDTRFCAAALILLVAISAAFWAILVKYLENEGIHPVQLFVLSQFCTLLYSSVIHLVGSTRDWYQDLKRGQMISNDERQSHADEALEQLVLQQTSTQTADEKTRLLQAALHTGESDSVSGNQSYTRSISTSSIASISELEIDINFKHVWKNLSNLKFYILSIFPSKNSRGLKVGILRGITNAISTQLCLIGFIFLDSGDAMLIRTTVSSLIMLIVGVIYFDEKLTKWLILAFIIALIGLTLTIQPEFLFDISIDDQISIIGLVIIVASAIFCALDKTVIKYSGKKGVTLDWFALLLISYFVTAVFGIIEIICLSIYYYVVDNGDVRWNDKVWYEWNNSDITIVFILFSLIVVFEICCQMFAFQTGDIGKLGILVSSEIAFTYMLEALLLDTKENYLVYIGVVLVTIYSSIVLIEQGKQAQERLNALNENNDEDNDNDREYDTIDDIDSGDASQQTHC